MKLQDKFKLVLYGRPINSKYHLALTEEEFKKMAKAELIEEDDLNPFSLNSARFTGYFHGHYSREFSLKPKHSFFRKNSITNSIWINGKIEKSGENSSSISVTFNRTNFVKYGLWSTLTFLLLILLIGGFKILENHETHGFLVYSSSLVIFIVVIISIFVADTGNQIKYYESSGD